MIVRLDIRSIFTLFFACFFHIGFAQEPYSLTKKEGYYGLKDKEGTIVIAPVYDQIGWSNGNFEWVDNLIGYSYRGKWGLLNIKNKKTSPAIYYKLSVIEGGNILASVKGNLSNQLFTALLIQKGLSRLVATIFQLSLYLKVI